MNATRRRLLRVGGVLLASALVACAAATPAPSKVIGHGVRLKGTKVWYAHGKAIHPSTLSAKVVPVPAQAVKVQWAINCQKPSGDPAIPVVNGTSGQVTVHAAATVKLKLPYVKPPTCIATVYATLAKEGGLTLSLLQG